MLVSISIFTTGFIWGAVLILIADFIVSERKLSINYIKDIEKKLLKILVSALISAVLFTAIYFTYGLTYSLFKYCTMAMFIMLIAVIDFKTSYVYSITTIPGIITGIIFIFMGVIFNLQSMSEYLSWVPLIITAVLSILSFIGGIGWGDIETLILCFVFLGTRLYLLTLVFSFILCGIVLSLVLLFNHKKMNKRIPFCPFISVASILTVILSQYMNPLFNLISM